MNSRLPLSGLYTNLQEKFRQIVWQPSLTGKSSVMVYDNEMSELLQGQELFNEGERSTAIKLFQENTRKVSGVRFESLILNAPSFEVLKIMHPRFFL